MNEDFPENEVEFDRRFHTEQACLDYLFQLRWSGALVVPAVVIYTAGPVPEGFSCVSSADINNR